MSTIPAHPSWCDPRLCTGDSVGTEHRATPMAWTAGDHRITIGRSRYDEVLASGDITLGAEQARLDIEDEASLNADGGIAAIELALPAADARLLAAALDQTADRLALSTGRNS